MSGATMYERNEPSPRPSAQARSRVGHVATYRAGERDPARLRAKDPFGARRKPGESHATVLAQILWSAQRAVRAQVGGARTHHAPHAADRNRRERPVLPPPGSP